MKKKYYFPLLIACITIVPSCGKSVISKKIVLNSTTYTLQVSIFDKKGNKTLKNKFVITPQTTAVLEDFNNRDGALYYNQQSCINPNDSIAVEVNDNQILKNNLDLNNADNWVYSRVSENAEHIQDECKATIKNSDITTK